MKSRWNWVSRMASTGGLVAVAMALIPACAEGRAIYSKR